MFWSIGNLFTHQILENTLNKYGNVTCFAHIVNLLSPVMHGNKE